jgi:putative ABC transport system permease protein
MLKHFWNTAVRNLIRNKLFTSINIAGLSLSIAIFLALTGYVNYQFSYDKFLDDADRVYRVDYYEYQQGQPILQSARTHDRTGLLLHEFLPQSEAVTRAYYEVSLIFNERARIADQKVLWVDSSFLKVFDLPLVSGSRETSLEAPNSMMISESQAAAYFGQEDPVGKTVFFNEHLPFTITGVFKDVPSNSSLEFDFLLSWSTMRAYGWISYDGDFSYPWTFTFVKLKPHATDLSAMNQALADMAAKYVTTLDKRSLTGQYQLRPYTELHHATNLSGELKPGTNKALTYSMLSLAIFILVAAWINYINLSLAQSIERADEIGVRKVFGATGVAISGQFLVQAFILSVLTFFTGYGLYAVFTGPWSNVFFTDITFLNTTNFTLIYFVAFIVCTTIVAFYPAYFISRYKPALILKNKLGGTKGSAGYIHQGLMIFQLFLAVGIVGITIIAGRQIQYMREFDSGFSSQQTISLRAPASTNSDSIRYSRYLAFRDEVLQQTAFTAGGASMNIPGQEIRFHDEAVHAVGSENLQKQSYWVMWVDEGYQETFGLTLKAGRNFNPKEFGNTCIINETAAKTLGYATPEDAVGTKIIDNENQTITIAGVWKDYHHESIHKAVGPTIFYYRHPHEFGYYSFTVASRQGDFLQALQKIWVKHYPNDPFLYHFMDSFFEEQYRADELFGKLLNLFSIISVTVACLGLFGMASLAMVKKTKEIGIRKVLGASVWNILVMLSKTYVRLIIISCVIAFPLAYYLTDQWLGGFAYKIDVQWWMIVLPGVIVLVVTLFTIAGQSIKAALANPTKSLRNE